MENNKNRIPRVGDEIYVPTSLYISHGEDDVAGGLATIVKVSMDKDYIWVVVVEHPGVNYNWEFLVKDQEKLKNRFGKNRAHPDPDYRPSSNTGW